MRAQGPSPGFREWVVVLAAEPTPDLESRARDLATWKWGSSATVRFEGRRMVFYGPDSPGEGEAFARALERGEGVPVAPRSARSRRKRTQN